MTLLYKCGRHLYEDFSNDIILRTLEHGSISNMKMI
jgi:hypothetical protein